MQYSCTIEVPQVPLLTHLQRCFARAIEFVTSPRYLDRAKPQGWGESTREPRDVEVASFSQSQVAHDTCPSLEGLEFHDTRTLYHKRWFRILNSTCPKLKELTVHMSRRDTYFSHECHLFVFHESLEKMTLTNVMCRKIDISRPRLETLFIRGRRAITTPNLEVECPNLKIHRVWGNADDNSQRFSTLKLPTSTHTVL